MKLQSLHLLTCVSIRKNQRHVQSSSRERPPIFRQFPVLDTAEVATSEVLEKRISSFLSEYAYLRSRHPRYH